MISRGDGEAEAGPAFGLTGGTVETVEDVRETVGWDAGAGVAHGEAHKAQRGGRGGERDHSARRGKLGRVGKEIDENVADPGDIHGEPAEFGVALDLKLSPGGGDETAGLGGDSGEQIGDRDLGAVEGGGTGFEAREVEQAVEDPEQAIGIVARGLEQLALRRDEFSDVFLEEQIERETETGERSLELMADGAGEVGLGVVEQAELGDVLKK